MYGKNKFKKKNELVKNSKYKSEKIVVDGIRFHSKLESRFYQWITSQPKITLLELQPKFILQDKFRTKDGEAIRAIVYIADFYIEYEGDRYYVDSKGAKEPVFKIKYKMWQRRYGDENILLICKSIKELMYAIGM